MHEQQIKQIKKTEEVKKNDAELAYYIEDVENTENIKPQTQQITAEKFIELACDPLQNVSISACAGSGKTWLLASRILRLLLIDVQPEKILALTFTKKAAFEMQERVLLWLADWQHLNDEKLTQELKMRGISATEITESLLNKARGLYHNFITQKNSLNMCTFDVWFKKLLDDLPCGLILTQGDDLLDQSSEYFSSFLKKLAAELQNLNINNKNIDLNLINFKKHLQNIKDIFDIDYSELKLNDFIKYFNMRDVQIKNVQNIKNSENPENLKNSEIFFLNKDEFNILKQGMQAALLPYKKTAKYEKCWQKLEDAKHPRDIYQAILTSTKTILKLDKAEGFTGDAYKLKELYEKAFSKALETCLAYILYFYQHEKLNDNLYDFGDILHQLLFVLDLALNNKNNYKNINIKNYFKTQDFAHILLDEFQDTNPSQWAVIKNYLQIRCEDSGKPPILFIVGDNKQAIYRFRGGDVRVMQAPFQLDQSIYKWCRLSTQNTRRCPQKLIADMNAALAPENTGGKYPIFVAHTSSHADLGEAYVLPAAQSPEEEFKNLATHLLHLKKQNPELNWQDFLIISKSRSNWPLLQKALMQAGVPYFINQKGGLLQSAPVCDVLALIHLALNKNINNYNYNNNEIAYYTEIIENSPLNSFYQSDVFEKIASDIRPLNAHDFLNLLYLKSNIFELYPHPIDTFYLQQILSIALDYCQKAHYSSFAFLHDLEKQQYSSFASETPTALLPSMNAVQINTIHGVKGLEAKWVILIETQKSFVSKLTMVCDWPIEAAYPKKIFIGHKAAYEDFARSDLDEEITQQTQAYYNLLYVAMTRAKHGFIATATIKSKITEHSWYDLLSKKLEIFEKDINDIEDNINIIENNLEENSEKNLKVLSYDFNFPDYKYYKDDKDDKNNINNLESNENNEDNLNIINIDDNFNNQLYGKLCHAILQILGANPLNNFSNFINFNNININLNLNLNQKLFGILKNHAIIRQILNNNVYEDIFKQAITTVLNLLQQTHLNIYFNPKHYQQAFCEYNIFDQKTQKNFRIDRLLKVNQKHYIIIDYKFSNLEKNNNNEQYNYQAQLNNYKNILHDMLAPIINNEADEKDIKLHIETILIAYDGRIIF